MTLEIQVLAWDRHNNVTRLKWLNVISTPPFLISESTNGNTYINKDKNPAQIHFHSKGPHTITKNERQSKLGQYNNRVNEY